LLLLLLLLLMLLLLLLMLLLLLGNVGRLTGGERDVLTRMSLFHKRRRALRLRRPWSSRMLLMLVLQSTSRVTLSKR
jgi:hypothetical protein